ncbi:MAG: 30S ribosomal protein S1 [Gammaproteobacteria bacterium]|nr:30S ribosomal protein S1 [Gammaproteobacteria bacterium]MCY4165312.1 30S ribosomal protein S1 [Gammaproteobacteria bacterium]MCY4256469.1 30S ribosomal protein S1 [Gammaproteobacteria bacterium]MCY4340612.1 30S ribosomal protein S1 [Gammaproteobacteria bacterium]
MAESFAELVEANLAQRNFRPGEILSAQVIDISPEIVTVSAGLKSEALIPASQFMDETGELEVDIGDEVEVALDSMEDGFGETRLSRERAKRTRVWENLESAFDQQEIVQGAISGRVKGGFTVDVSNVRAFLPGSLVDMHPIRDTTYLEGRKLDFKVIKLDRRRNNVVVSRRAVIEELHSAERAALLASLEEGQVVDGVVKNLTEYGAFVDLGGIDGLLHVTDMAWRRVKHPSEVVEVGQELQVKILRFDSERNRVSLGLKQLGEDPWVDIARRYPPHTRLFGKVTNVADYGCFVQIEEGVEGLVHVSEMDWTSKNVNPGKIVHVGQEVEVMVLDINEERRRVSLGLKQCMGNPWQDFASNHKKDDRVAGKVRSMTDFGIFIGLEGNIDGLVHLSDLSWDIPGEEAVRNYRKGQEVEAVVLSIDADRERISLGIRQLQGDPLASFLRDHPKGSVVTAVVTSVEQRRVDLELAEGVSGRMRAAELSREHVDDARMQVKQGQSIEARIVGVDRKSRLVSLSVRAMEEQAEAEALRDYEAEVGERIKGATLGELLRSQQDQDAGKAED